MTNPSQTPQQAQPAANATSVLPWSSQALFDIACERRRQVEVKGMTLEHDDEHVRHEIAHAAACYAYPELTAVQGLKTWPWEPESFVVRDHRANCVRAAALLLAEIERLDREEALCLARGTDSREPSKGAC